MPIAEANAYVMKAAGHASDAADQFFMAHQSLTEALQALLLAGAGESNRPDVTAALATVMGLIQTAENGLAEANAADQTLETMPPW